MKTELPLVFYHAPNTRSTGVLLLLEELGAPYLLQVLNVRRGEHKAQAYRDVNPLGKVPAIRHGTALVTEQVAIYIYLADLFPASGLAPPIGDPLRGPYLRSMSAATAFSALARPPANEISVTLPALLRRRRTVSPKLA